MNDILSRLDNLEAWQKSVNTDIATLKTLVETLNSKDFVTSVESLADGSGYVINFKNSGAVTIKHGTSGADGSTPAVGTKQHTDNKYYWTIDGEWMLDSTGGKLPVTGEDGADAVSPKMRINSESNMWEVSTDGGATWTSTGVKATGENGTDGDSFFQSVDDSNPNFVIVTLTDGTILKLPKLNSVTVGFDNYENVVISRNINEINIILPSTFKESDYGAIMAEVIGDDGSTGVDIVTRGASDWTVDITKPTFTGGVYNNNAKVKLTANNSVVDSKALLRVTVVTSKGVEITSTMPFTYVDALLINNAPSVSSLDDILVDLHIELGQEKFGKKIIVTGEMNQNDFLKTDVLSSPFRTYKFTHVDLSKVTIVGTINIAKNNDIYTTQEGNAIPLWGLENCKLLESIILPKNITTVGNSAFFGCTALASIEIPANVRTLGRWVFEGCTSLATITLNEGLETLSQSAFYGCGVESITIPESVTTIGSHIFSECHSLTEVIINSQIEELPVAMFHNSTNLSNVTLPSTIKRIGASAFYNSGLVDFVIPNGITTIGEGAFSECKKLKTVTIPGTVQDMLWGVFAFNPLLETVTIEEGISSIDAEAFRDCVKLNNVVLPSTITQIRDRAFQGCAGLTSLTCKATTPPSLIEHNTGENFNFHFSEITQSLTLYVSAGSESSYTANWVPLFKSMAVGNSVTVAAIIE